MNNKKSNLTGCDADIETSLKEYGIAWRENDQDGDTKFYYGVDCNDIEYTHFSWGWINPDVNLEKEFDWVEWEKVEIFMGCNVKENSLTDNIQVLLQYYGHESVFGGCYGAVKTYEEIMAE